MWTGKWSRELSVLYDDYYDLFEIEPDCDLEAASGIDFDTISYNDFKARVIRSIITRQYFSTSSISRAKE